MDKFCVACHAAEADASHIQPLDFFSSMDESKSRAPSPAAPPVAPEKKAEPTKPAPRQ